MLTKDLLKVKLSKGSIFPQFIDPKDAKALQIAAKLLEVVNGARGKTQSQIEEALSEETEIDILPYASGFVKLLLDQIEYEDSKEDGESSRWDMILAAQNMRQENYFKGKEEFQETLSSGYSKDFLTLSKKLYSDLPEFRLMEKTLTWGAQELIHRYNCALVQSLFLQSPKVEVCLLESSAVEKRNLFRAVKFHSLVVGDIRNEKSKLTFSIDGPLSLLVNTQAYGMRLANFFPRLLIVDRWQIEATVQYKKKNYSLSLSHNDGLKSHYREWGDYVPEEFNEFLKSFNKSSSIWQGSWCEELIALGEQQFCFPDISFVHQETGKKLHLELFHRWHRGELEKRLRILQKTKDSQIIIGICNSLLKQANIGVSSIREEEFQGFGFIFRGVPTPKAVSTLLNGAYGDP